MAKNPCGKSRKVENPYEVYKGFGPLEGWIWKVLKKNQSPEGEAKNEFASWFCAVSSPHTFGGCDMGDTYVADVLNGYSMLVEIDGVKVENPIPTTKRTMPKIF